MTNTESRIAVGLDELGPWDDADAHDNDEQITEADIRELAAYGFDSDKQTLVGLGPVERRRRARKAAEMLDGQRLPPSEPPGPFIADDVDEEVLRSLRRPRLRAWTLSVPAALVVAAVALALVRGFTPSAPAARKLMAGAHAPRAAAALPAKLDPVSSEPASLEGSGASDRHDTESLPEPVQVEPHRAAAPAASALTTKQPIAATALPVTLPEQPSPTVSKVPGAADASVGALNLTSSPPANVVLDGRPLGQAPRLVQVPPGTHTVLFIHPLYGRRTLNVSVSAGQTASASTAF